MINITDCDLKELAKQAYRLSIPQGLEHGVACNCKDCQQKEPADA